MKNNNKIICYNYIKYKTNLCSTVFNKILYEAEVKAI